MSQQHQEKKKKVVSIALLVADTPPPPVVAVRGDYTKIYPRFLQESLNTIKRHPWQPHVELHIRCYDVVNKMEYPDEGQLGDGLWDAVMITGSASSAYLDLEWTKKLAAFLRATAENHPLVRLIGICYGHQILSRAFDGVVEANPRAGNWEPPLARLPSRDDTFLATTNHRKETRWPFNRCTRITSSIFRRTLVARVLRT